MREELAKVEGQRHVYTATFVRFGRKAGWQGRQVVTLLFRDVKTAAGEPATDHIWFTMTKGFEQLGLKPGDRVRFKANSRPYQKGYQGARDYEDVGTVSTDFKFAFPNEIEIIQDGVSDDSQLPLLAAVACPSCGGSRDQKCKCEAINDGKGKDD